MDATQLAKGFGAGEFDLVVDKGLLDSMHLAGEPVRAQTLPCASPRLGPLPLEFAHAAPHAD